MSIVLGKDEKNIVQDSFTANLVLFWLKANYALTNKRVTGNTPNTFLGLIPFGSAQISQPLKTVASVQSSSEFKIKRLIVGLILVGIGYSVGTFSLFGIVFMLLGAINILNCYTATFIITNNAGQSSGYEISILESSRVEAFTEEVNTAIADL